MSSIAVIVPTFNRPLLLKQALASLAQQTDPPAEIIVVDDGSTPPVDAEVLSAEFGPSLRVLRNPTQRGLAFCRALGVHAARSEFVAHLDDDDMFAPNAVESAAAAFVADPALEVVFMGTAGVGSGAKQFNTAQLSAEQHLLQRAGATELRAGEWRLGPELISALLHTVPISFQRSVMRRDTWLAIQEIRLRAYGVDRHPRDPSQVAATLDGWLRDSEFALYAAAMCSRMLFLRHPFYLQRCEGQGLSSRAENIDIHLQQLSRIKRQLRRASQTIPQLRPWRRHIRKSMAETDFDLAYRLTMQRHRARALFHAMRSAMAWPRASLLRLLPSLLLLR